MNPEDLQKLSKEKLVEKLREFNLQEEQVMASMVMIREELLHRLEEQKIDGELVGEFQIKKAERITFKTSLDEAKNFGAIKEAVDTSVLRKLHRKGIKIPGTNTTTYLSVRRISQEEEQ